MPTMTPMIKAWRGVPSEVAKCDQLGICSFSSEICLLPLQSLGSVYLFGRPLGARLSRLGLARRGLEAPENAFKNGLMCNHDPHNVTQPWRRLNHVFAREKAGAVHRSPQPRAAGVSPQVAPEARRQAALGGPGTGGIAHCVGVGEADILPVRRINIRNRQGRPGEKWRKFCLSKTTK